MCPLLSLAQCCAATFLLGCLATSPLGLRRAGPFLPWRLAQAWPHPVSAVGTISLPSLLLCPHPGLGPGPWALGTLTHC